MVLQPTCSHARSSEAPEHTALRRFVARARQPRNTPRIFRVSSPRLQRDAAFLQAIDVARGLQRLHDVLLDDDERQALGDDRRNARVDVADHDRREAEADLVAQQQPRVRHQRAADGDHLLLAAGQRRRRLVAALGQHREQLIDALEIPRPGPAELAADQEILLDGERGKQPPPFRHQRDAARHHLVRRPAADRHAVEQDGVAARPASRRRCT